MRFRRRRRVRFSGRRFRRGRPGRRRGFKRRRGGGRGRLRIGYRM